MSDKLATVSKFSFKSARWRAFQLHCKHLRNKPTTGSHCRKHCIKLNGKEGNEREKLKVLCTIKKIHPFQNNRIRKGTILFIHKSFVTKSSKVFTRIKRVGGQGGDWSCSQNLVALLSLKLHFYKGKRGSYSYDKRTNILTKYYWSNPQVFTVYRFKCMYKLGH